MRAWFDRFLVRTCFLIAIAVGGMLADLAFGIVHHSLSDIINAAFTTIGAYWWIWGGVNTKKEEP